MNRPLGRDELSRPLPDEVRRQNLIDLLAARWTVKTLVVEAAGGFGKSRAIAQAIRDNDTDPSGIDFYISCRQAHRDMGVFAKTIVGKLSASSNPDHNEPTHPLMEILAQMRGFSPTAICLHLDDAHVIADSPKVLSLLTELIQTSPDNTHFVMAGRTIPDAIPSSTPGVQIGEEELGFSEAEIAKLASTHGVDAASLPAIDGWPAMTRLALAVGPNAPKEFLIEEVIHTLNSTQKVAIGCTAMAGHATAELLTRADLDVDIEQLVAGTPLLEALEDGGVRAHSLWLEALDSLVTGNQQVELAKLIASWHSAAGRHDEAISCAANANLWTLARQCVMNATALGDVVLVATTARRWLSLFPADQMGEPEVLFLSGLVARLADGPEHGKADVAAALAIFDERGDIGWSAVVATELGMLGWLTADTELVIEVMGRSSAEREAGVPHIEALENLGLAGASEMVGELPSALEFVSAIDIKGLPRPLAELVVRYATGLAFLVGESEQGLRTVAELLPLERSPRNEFVVAMSHFNHGDPQYVLNDWAALRYRTVGNRRDDFWIAACSCLVDAAFGITPNTHLVEELAWDRTREDCYLSLSLATAAITRGDETEAAALISALVARVGFADPLSEAELRRFIEYTYVLSEQARDHFDSSATSARFGPLHLSRLALARIVVALRAGERPNWSGYPGPEITLCGSPLPWSLEVACGLMDHDETAAVELAQYLLVVAGPTTAQILRTLASDEHRPFAANATILLGRLPTPPAAHTRLHLCGDLSVERSGSIELLSGARVKQVLALLVLRGSVTRRDATRLLWPDMDFDRGGRNFRVALSSLRAKLEPDRQTGEPTYHLQDTPESVTLRPSDHLSADVWDIDKHLLASASLAVQDRLHESVEAARMAVALWSGPLFSELDHIAELHAEIGNVRFRVREAAVRVAERLLADGHKIEAVALSHRVVAEDHFNEAARCVTIAAHLDDGDVAAAGVAVDDLSDVLGELGASPAATTRMLMKRYAVRTALTT